MSNALMESTQITITMTIQVDTDRETEFLFLLMLLLAPLKYFYKALNSLKLFHFKVRLWLFDLSDMLDFIGKVIVITVKSFAYGVGLMQ